MPPGHPIESANFLLTTFVDLGVPEALSRVLSQQGITDAFPIQSKTLPDSLSGRDVLGRGRTGSGKTVAFSLPLVARLAGLTQGASKASRRPNRPTGLVLAPTRELATQIDRTVAPLAKAAGLNTTVIYGGVSQKHQERALAAGVDIVVACPGRLEDLLKQGVLTLDDVRVTVIDEADHMADMGFLPVVTRILQRTPREGQRLLFSATLDGGVDVLVKKFLDNPVTHSVDEPKATVSTMEHHVLVVDAEEKQQLIETLASGTGRRVMFTRTKYRAKKMAKKLSQAGLPAVDLHGNLSQNARDRNLEAFSTGEVRVLVATDVAARGVHVDDVELVVHIDPPAEHKSYLHRSGRTARAGAEGQVITISTTEEQRDVQKLMKQAGVTAEISQINPGSPVVAELVGERAERVAYAPPAKDTGGSGRGGSNGSGKSSTKGGGGGKNAGRQSQRSDRSERSGGRGQGGRASSDGSRQGGQHGRGGQNGRRGEGRGRDQNRDQNQGRNRGQGRNDQQSRSAAAGSGARRSYSAASAVNLHSAGASAVDRSTQAAARRRNRRAGAATGAPSGR